MESDNRPTTADKFTQTPRRFRTKSGAIRSPFVYVNVSRKSASSQQPQSPRSKATQVSPDRSTKSDAVPDMDQDVTPACIGEFVSSRSTQTTPAARMTSDASTQTDVTGSVMMGPGHPNNQQRQSTFSQVDTDNISTAYAFRGINTDRCASCNLKRIRSNKSKC